MVQICGAGIAPIVFKTCGNWGGRVWYISIVSISISSIVSQVEKAVSPTQGFNSMKSWRDVDTIEIYHTCPPQFPHVLNTIGATPAPHI